MPEKKIRVEIDEKENTRWVTIDGNHYPFLGAHRQTLLELELKTAEEVGFVHDNESYREFKERVNE